MPSSSARCSQLPRAVDKLPFYVALHKLRDHLRGDLPHLDDTEVTFPDLEMKVEPKKETRVKQETPDPETDNSALVSNHRTDTFQVEIKTELVTGKQKNGRRKRSSVTGSDGKEISNPTAVGSLSGTVSSPYFLSWQQPSLYNTESAGAGNCTTAEAVDLSRQVKWEMPFDFAQYGYMPSTVRTNSSLLPLPDVKPRSCWPPTNL